MIPRFVDALQELDPQPTAEELADALWLADWLRTHTGVPHPPADDVDGPAESPLPDPRPSVRSRDPLAEREQRTDVAQAPEARLYLTEKDLPVASFPVRAPAMPAIARTLRLARALRPLRAVTPSLTHAYLDEDATAQRIAETGVCEPIMRASPERRHDLALVVDVSSSMVVWRQMAEELRTLLEQLGAFRDVRVWYVDTDGRRLALRTGATSGEGTDRSPDELVDPTGRRIVLVVSDCIGTAWQSGRVAALLERWGRAGPVVIAQPLPQRLWWRTAAAVEPVRFTASGPARASDRLTAIPAAPHYPPTERRAGVPVPVVELSERWLRPWAALVAHGGQNVMGAALFTGRPVADMPPLDSDTGVLPAADRVMRFRAASSPTAFRLATFLAAAPLRLPVMRLVQQAMLPDSTTADLAEVFLSGLLRRVSQPAGQGADEPAYEFHEGVRDILLGGLQRREVLQVLRSVWDVVRVRIGSSLDFPALLAAVHRGEPELPPDLPFAQVAAHALARLGGRYREIAEQLTLTVTDPGTSAAGRTSDEAAPTAGPVEHLPVLRGGMPTRNPHFTGREELLSAVRTALARGVAALMPHPASEMSGTGGEGKSQLAVEYAYRHADDYDLVWWIPAEQPTSARAALERLARLLGTPLSDDIKDTVSGVLQALYRGTPYGRWLLIYDNAEDPDTVLPLTPLAAAGPGDAGLEPGRHVLVTTRDRDWERHASPIDVDVFARSESIRFLTRVVRGLSEADADRLSQRVGDLPLAVQQAAAWQLVTEGTAEDYLRMFDERLAELPESYESAELPGPLAVSVRLTLDRLRQDNRVAGLLLELWAVFGPEPVSARLLTAGREAALPTELTALLADEDELRAAMRVISRFSLARFDEEGGTLQAHRLVRAVLDMQLTDDDRRNVQGYVHAILAAATPEEEPEVESTWRRRAEITPHVVPSGIVDADGPAARRVSIDQAKFLYLSGDFEGSRVQAAIALSRWRDRDGPDSEEVLDMSRTLANALRGLGDNSAAAKLSEDTLLRMRRRFGADHIQTLFTAIGFGADLRFRGEFRRAHEIDRDAWQRMRRLGDGHPSTLLAASNLGVDLRILGRFQEARDIDEDVLRRQAGSAHSDRQRFNATHHLARDLHALGRYTEAYRLQAGSLKVRRPVLPSGHAMVLQAKMSHAGTLRKLGRLEDARALATEALAAHVRRFGEDHPNTLASKVCMAMATCSAGDAEQGLGLIDEALEGYRRVMGEDHPFVHVCAVDRAVILRRLGGTRAAWDVDDNARSALRAGILGADHYYSLCAVAGLAGDHYLLGEHAAAADLLAMTYEQFRRSLGEAHPYSLKCAHNLEQVGIAMGRPSARAGRILAALESALGSGHHPEIIAAAQGELLECDIEPTAL